MVNTSALVQQAIQAAKDQDWEAALIHNQALLEETPSDIPALTRLGVAYAQLDRLGLAKTTFLKVLELDKSNQLVKKHLDKLAHHQHIALPSLASDEQFIEEPGKTKIVELHRLAGKDQLEKISLGQACQLKPKGRYISVEAEQKYVGSLPEDLSSRLAKLIQGGNTYACAISSLSNHSVTVFLKELTRAKEFAYVNSFPATRGQLTTINEMYMDDDVALDLIENIPPQIVSSDEDDHTAIESLPHLEENQEETPLPDDDDRDNT